VQGRVVDSTTRPVVGADVTLRGTPFHAATDALGQFVLANLPSGPQILHADGRLAVGSRFTGAFRAITVPDAGTQTLEAMVLVPQAPAVPIDLLQGGHVTFPGVPDAAVDLPAQALQVPTGVAPGLSLTLLPVTALPFPVPDGFRIGAAAELGPASAILAVPATLSLPNQGELPAGQAVTLLRLDETTLTYVATGRGRVSDDSSVITTTGGGLLSLGTVVFARVSAGRNSQLRVAAGDGQTGVVGMPLLLPLTVTVLDQNNTPTPDIPVTFTIVSGNGQLSASVVPTSPAGEAATHLTLGTSVGIVQIRASVDGLAPVAFTITGQADRATARLLPVSGNNQVGQPGQELPEPLVVRLEDQFSNPLPGEAVTAEIVGGAAEFIGTTTAPAAVAVVDAQGEAAFRLRVAAEAANSIVTRVSALSQQVEFLTIVGPVAIEADGSLVVASRALRAVVRVDPVTGTRSVVSGCLDQACSASRGRGLGFESPQSITVEADGTLVLCHVETIG